MIGRSPALANGYGTLGATGLTTSRLGFGTYRVGMNEREHRDALLLAIRNGCNLVDTSTNYMDGDSERLVGSVLAELIKAGELKRECVIVVSKIGYVQGENLKTAESRERAGRPYPEMVKHGEGVWHCIHPQFLADQLTLSLDRLSLDTLDICLLHNPEYFLSETARRGEEELERLRANFYDRLQRAFVYFESQVAAGRLQYYGVSSNTLAAGADNPEATSAARMLAAAHAAARAAGQQEHHLRVLQCPMNLFESSPAMTPNTGENGRQTLLEFAQQEGLAVLVNRPLNAMPAGQRGILRLSDLPLEDEPLDVAVQLEEVARLEKEYRDSIAPSVRHAEPGMPPSEYFNWAEELGRIRSQIQGFEHWEQIEHQMIAPHVNQVLQALSRLLTGALGAQWQAWRDRYVPELLALLGALRHEATERSRKRTAMLAGAIDSFLPEARRRETLSRKALWIALSTPGVTCVLNGMRTAAYVADSLSVLAWEPLQESSLVYQHVNTLTIG
jgi:aryl-alcohol dehydrogenase-like predicted oxidoreductase